MLDAQSLDVSKVKVTVCKDDAAACSWWCLCYCEHCHLCCDSSLALWPRDTLSFNLKESCKSKCKWMNSQHYMHVCVCVCREADDTDA